MARSSKATLALLIYGILMHYSAYCTSIGVAFPKMRLENDVFDEDGNSLSDLGFDTDQIAIRSSPSLTDDVYTLYYPPEKRAEKHADGLLDRALRDILVQLSARKYLHSLMAVRVGQPLCLQISGSRGAENTAAQIFVAHSCSSLLLITGKDFDVILLLKYHAEGCILCLSEHWLTQETTRVGGKAGLRIVASRSSFKCSLAILAIGMKPGTEQGVLIELAVNQ
ncbi:hypothetical protein P4O66_008280 [Electrophorus voltai]|uniref:Glucagon / GIP / secretin / VIP family domain-containing protein n=1 Tax=Electrophorus voltai TaxID=2609070 RepID=A0AAD9DZR3_9TELE|nr:hypothetical protein P4O66_008280 [Electrophorus voltai]